jgi:hypothetical protein
MKSSGALDEVVSLSQLPSRVDLKQQSRSCHLAAPEIPASGNELTGEACCHAVSGIG